MTRYDFEKKKQEFFDWCKRKWGLTKEKAAEIWDKYKWEIITFGPIVIGAIIKGADSFSRMQKTKSEENHRRYDIYDHSTGQYYHLKRPMTTQEQLELERRLGEGEKKGQILRDMGLI